MKIGFIGCHEISWHCLKVVCHLMDCEDELLFAVNFNKKDKAISSYIDFKYFEQNYGIPVHYVNDVNTSKGYEIICKYKLDILFIIGWHKIVSAEVLSLAKNTIGIHTSYLPYNRGSCPMNWQLINGDDSGGVTMFHINEDVDTGDIIDQRVIKIHKKDDIKILYDKAIFESVKMIEVNWCDIKAGTINKIKQNLGEGNVNQIRRPRDGQINWNETTDNIINFVRALTVPYPGAYTYLYTLKLYVWKVKKSTIINSNLQIGGITVIKEKIYVKCFSDTLVELVSVQPINGPIMTPKLFNLHYKVDLKLFGRK